MPQYASAITMGKKGSKMPKTIRGSVLLIKTVREMTIGIYRHYRRNHKGNKERVHEND